MNNSSDMFRGERCLIFDESGNLGNSGRYFVIACIDTLNYKSLQNMMKNKLRIAKKQFNELAKLHSNEIKAKDAYPCIKYHLLEAIAEKDISISYIVADLHHVKAHLLNEKNILYNYMMKLLIERLVSVKDNHTVLNIICDNHTTKVGSVNSFEEYIKLYLLYEREYNIDLNIIYMDSDDGHAYPVQAADYVANALYGFYEYNSKIYYDRIIKKIKYKINFPYQTFGK